MADTEEGMRVLDLDPVHIKQYCQESEDALAGAKIGFCYDYYPALGKKEIKVWGVDTNNALLQPPVKLIVYDVVGLREQGFDITPEAAFDNGIARLYIEANDAYAGSAEFDSSEKVNLAIQVTVDGPTAELNNANRSTLSEIVTLRINVRNNANVTFDEVLRGEAVYVASDNPKPSTTTELTNSDGEVFRLEGFDYVQELLNQVVPRKRGLFTDPFAEDDDPDDGADPRVPVIYTLINERSGLFNAETVNSVKLFRKNFAVGNNISFTPLGETGRVTYDDQDTTSAIYRKLSKDYGFRDVSTLPNRAKMETYLAMIVDKGLLVGDLYRPYAENAWYAPDQLINQPIGQGEDTGLYELYTNVVERFVDGMIAEAERYAGEKGTPGVDAPKDNWYSRGSTTTNGYGPEGCDTNTECAGPHGKGMSYSFGGRQTIETFNRKVSRWKAPPNSVYGDVTDLDSPAQLTYRGNINEATGQVGASSGGKQWAGVYSYRPPNNVPEERAWANRRRTHQDNYYPRNWAGIDCVGLVLRSMKYADSTLQDANLSFQTVSSGGVAYSIISDTGLRFLGTDNFRKSYYKGKSYHKLERTERTHLKRGDVILYKGHISIFYSEKYGESVKKKDYKTVYDIIHASGDAVRTYRDRFGNDVGPEFARKVQIDSPGAGLTNSTLNSPKFYGRLKLWE